MIEIIDARERDMTYFVEMPLAFRRPRCSAPSLSDDLKIPMNAMPNQYPHKEQETLVIDTTPIHGVLHTLPPITLLVASQSSSEPLWDHLVRRYHYLGYQKLLGHRLKYLAFLGDRPVAALSFSAPALKLRVRDAYIGWSPEQRKAHLDRIVSNSRFLIPPWVMVPNLASHLLALATCRLSRDWEERFGSRPWLVETFVDPARFKGTCYKAANWQSIGQTFGSGKKAKGYIYHGVVKEVYLYALEPSFRELIGCEQKSYDLFHRPSPSHNKVEDLRMILRHAGWSPNIVPCMDLTESDLELISDELVAFHKEFHDCFGRKEQLRLGLAYLSGLLSNKEVKSVEPIALEFLNKKSVRSLQMFMKTRHWDHEEMEKLNRTMLAQKIADASGMINLDSSEFIKKGKESVGVARQYCGRHGKVDNCQSGAFVGYSSDKGYGLLTSRLYMPKIWFTDEYRERREFNLVPDDLVFKTKPQIATELIKKIDATNLFPAKWIGCDATFGSDWDFLASLPTDKYYFASIKSDTQVFLRMPQVGVPPYKGRGSHPTEPRVLKGRAYTVKDVICLIPSWTKAVLDEGAKGPIVADVACLRVIPCRDGLPYESPLWLFIRRLEDGQIKYAFSNAPKDTPLAELCKAGTMRWPIEQCFQDGKSQVGMDQYEHRSWPAWHRHMTYVCLALHFLFRLRLQFKKNSSFDASTGEAIGCRSVTSQNPDTCACT
jgi:SRSO17 transposase